MSHPDRSRSLAEEVVALLTSRGLVLASAESLTGGGLGCAVTSVAGASLVYAGGVVSYATRLKTTVLGVPQEVVDGPGVVSAECARAMALGARRLLVTDLAVSTTGVAGPDAQEGKPVGLVHVAVADAAGTESREHRFPGGRAEVRAAAVSAALELLRDRLATR